MNKNNGITLVSLVVTIIILLIIASISIYSGKEIIKKAKLEELKTNMLLIEAKAKEYVEEATFKMGKNPTDEEKETVRANVYGTGEENGAQLEKATDVPAEFGITDSTTCYWLTVESQKKSGLDKIEMDDDEKYLIKFNETDTTVEIYNTKGYNGNYSLTDIEKIEE